MDQIPLSEPRQPGGRRRGAPVGNTNARKHGHWAADALELRALMRLQLRVAELGNAYLALAAAVVGLIDGEGDAAGRLERAYGGVDSRNAALVRAVAAMEKFLAVHGRMDEARDLLAEVAALVAPVPSTMPRASTAATG